ncbi:MAG: hypothetical protein ACN6O2_11875 [Stenotrophomonas sp.]
MTHEKYVQSIRHEAAKIAAGVISGEIPVLEGCNSLAALRHEIDVDEFDPDFLVFAMISSEIDTLPIGAARTHWAQDALVALEPEIQSAILWATPRALTACKSLLQRFGT